MTTTDSSALLDITELGAFLRSRGYRISQETLKRYCKPSIGKGPKAAGRWGRTRLFDPNSALKWARGRWIPTDNSGEAAI